MFKSYICSLNFRLNVNLVVKISDFGLTKNICDHDYYKSNDTEKPIPIRWMSIESFQLKKFTLASDVVYILNN